MWSTSNSSQVLSSGVDTSAQMIGAVWRCAVQDHPVSATETFQRTFLSCTAQFGARRATSKRVRVTRKAVSAWKMALALPRQRCKFKVQPKLTQSWVIHLWNVRFNCSFFFLYPRHFTGLFYELLPVYFLILEDGKKASFCFSIFFT